MPAFAARLRMFNLFSLVTAVLVGVGGPLVLGVFEDIEDGYTLGEPATWLIEHRLWMPVLPVLAIVLIVFDLTANRHSWLRRGLIALLLGATMVWFALGVILAVIGIYASAFEQLV